MTKPFLFASLDAGDLHRTSGISGDRNNVVAAEENDLGFPHLAFDLPRSTNVKTVGSAYTAQDLARAVEEARRTTALEVEAQTRAALAAELDHRQVEALEAIRDQLSASEEDLEQWISDATMTAQSLAKMMGQAIVPRALERQPFVDIGDMVRQSLIRLVDQPLIEIRLESGLAEQMAGLLRDIVEETGFQGELKAVADPMLSAGDVRLVWKSGVADRDFGRIREEADMLIDAWLDNPSQGQADAMSEPVRLEHDSSEEWSTS